jgi:Cytochrome c3
MGARTGLVACSLLTAAIGGYYGAPFALPGADKSALLPGRTSRGHYLIESSCGSCHTPFGGVDNDACLRCHGAALTAAEDTHPESRFTDPRNADRTAGLDARACVTCHREHAADRTREGGVTLPADFCGACHQDIGRERPSHAGFDPAGCAATGCHRFHDNRGLYEGFLARHLHEPEVLASPRVPRRAVKGPSEARDGGSAPGLTAADQDAPASTHADDGLVRAWEGSAHARAGIACTPCHGVPEGATGMIEWKDQPGSASCKGCHAAEEEGFAHSQHGVRPAAGLSPLVPAMARLPMRPEARAEPLGCDACHGAHAYDTRRAAVDACLGCHDDKHSRAYRASRHFLLWEREVAGEAAPGTGVSCATCHLPRRVIRTHGADVVRVDHDASANLRPGEKMVRSACLACHGLGFTLDALADRELVERNFNGRPAVHVGSLSMAERRLREGGDTP